MLKIKICGITNFKDAKLCESLGANALGFIFYNKSKRYIYPERAGDFINNLSPFTMKIGVFVNETIENVNKIAGKLSLNAVQLHGEENMDYISAINIPVIKSFRITPEFDFSILSKYEKYNLLLDSYSKEQYGGTGKKFNWDKIPIDIRNKIILSGGISVSNLEYIYKNIKPKAIDISSSIEKSPGIKDEQKIRELFNYIKYLGEKQC